MADEHSLADLNQSRGILAYDETSGELRRVKTDSSGRLVIGGTIAVGEVEVKNDVGNPVPVSGTVSVNEPVTVDGTVEITNDVGNPIPVSGASLAAIEADVDATRIAVQSLDTDVDVALSTRASEATLGALLTSAQLIDDTVYTDGTGTPSKALAIAGTDGTNPQIIKTDVNGELQVDVVTMPGISLTGDNADLDSGAGTDEHDVVAIGLPGAGGHLVGGTATNPLRTDPTGVTTQPVSGPLTDAQLRATPVPVSGTVSVNEPVTVDGTVGISGEVEVKNDSGTPLAVDEATLDVLLSTRAAEATLVQVRDHLDTVETKLQSLIDQTDTLELNTNARPSQKVGRTHRTGTGVLLAATTTIFTVTAGKTFYLTDLVLTARNADTVNVADIQITDNGTTKVPVEIGLAVVGSVAPAAGVSMTFSEPIPFTTNVRYDEVAGTVTASLVVVGYEE